MTKDLPKMGQQRMENVGAEHSSFKSGLLPGAVE